VPGLRSGTASRGKKLITMLATMTKTKRMKKDGDSSPWHSGDAKKARNPKFEARNKFKIIIKRKGITVPGRIGFGVLDFLRFRLD